MTDYRREITGTNHLDRGLSAIYSGKYDVAIDAFRAARTLNEDQFAAHAGLCLAYHELDQTSELFEAFEQLPVTDDSLAARLLVMAVAYYADSEYRLSLKKIHHSLKLAPIEALSHYVLGRTLLALRRYNGALLALGRAHAQAPEFCAVENLLVWTGNYLACAPGMRPQLLRNAATRLHQLPPTVDDIPKYNILHDQMARDYLLLTGRFRALDD